MEPDRVRRKDTTKGPPLRILSLDGGGVRGYSMLIILQVLMHRTFVEIEGRAPQRHEIPKPCDHFDLIVGTGTGGLIALMLGRLRLDVEQCKELYVRLTRMVFETDKTFAGIPFRSTLYKASLLEQAIKEAVREHTVSDEEGNDGASVLSPVSTTSRPSTGGPRRHQSNASVVSFSARSPSAQMNRPFFRASYGDPEARLAVTAIYKGTPRGGDPAILRSYDSRKEPAPEYDCKIWEAGRATCAIGLAFKPIRIGQSLFHDDGAGTFNPAPYALDEATVNEWPGREVGVFVSVGTGRRPRGTDQNSHLWYEGFLGEFAEARRRLIAKIEGCETIHERMKKEYLLKRGVNIENYYRLNVEVGVGEFGMNEWDRLGEISTRTKRYFDREAEQKLLQASAAKLSKIHRAKLRWEGMSNGTEAVSNLALPSISYPLAVELPGDFPSVPVVRSSPPSRQSYDSGVDRLSLPGSNPNQSPRSSGERIPSLTSPASPPRQTARPARKADSPSPVPAVAEQASDEEPDRLVVTAPTPAQYRTATGSDKIAIMGSDEYPRRQQIDPATSPTGTQHQPYRIEPPPLPPKTPLPESLTGRRRPSASTPAPPYPLDDDAPPPVNMARKPDYRRR
ncbi:hypothetical protein DL764_006937 [Monosporascus ibericus]|uniref:PNPLA domain-containing protein n=1 Tax=Monosporascus ibericus TaxID=155417 RepID=A0A4Q4T5P7_9PEZI|nr:hypothetical protein DL764_006937 [Monosporascus ibericus]